MNSDLILSGRISADLKWKSKELNSSLGALCSKGWMLSGPGWAEECERLLYPHVIISS